MQLPQLDQAETSPGGPTHCREGGGADEIFPHTSLVLARSVSRLEPPSTDPTVWIEQAIAQLEPEVAQAITANHCRWGELCWAEALPQTSSRNTTDNGWLLVLYATEQEDLYLLKEQAEQIAVSFQKFSGLPVYLEVCQGDPDKWREARRVALVKCVEANIT